MRRCWLRPFGTRDTRRGGRPGLRIEYGVGGLYYWRRDVVDGRHVSRNLRYSWLRELRRP
jgi:hypothetical protein